MRKLTTNDFSRIGLRSKPTPLVFVTKLKAHLTSLSIVKWRGGYLKKQELKEHEQAIREFKTSSIFGGYLCSSCDSFLLLVSQLFKVNIVHNYNGTTIHYTNILSNRTLNFRSNKGHFF